MFCHTIAKKAVCFFLFCFEGSTPSRAEESGACHFFTRINLFTILLSFDFPNLHYYPNHFLHIHIIHVCVQYILPNVRAAYIRNGILLYNRTHYEIANTIICYCFCFAVAIAIAAAAAIVVVFFHLQSKHITPLRARACVCVLQKQQNRQAPARRSCKLQSFE